MDTEKPFLFFSQFSPVERAKGSSGPSSYTFPSREKQVSRLSGLFELVKSAFKKQVAQLTTQSEGFEPERALVLETVGSVAEFYKAVKNIEGFEWLAEMDVEDIEPDEDFRDGDDAEKKLGGKLFLLMANHKAVEGLANLWKTYVNGEAFPRGQTKFRDVFAQLKDIRFWNAKDRLEHTYLMEDWLARRDMGAESVKIQIELFFRKSEHQRQKAESDLLDIINKANGKFISKCCIEEIAYHAILAEFPIHLADQVLEHKNAEIVKAEHIMFLRPLGQACLEKPVEMGEVQADSIEDDVLPAGDPWISVFDGLPVQNHSLLKNYVIVDDADNLEPSYPTESRTHGTAMAGVIVHGDLNSPALPIKRKIYVRPILRARPSFPGVSAEEVLFDDVLEVDLVHRAIRRMFEGEGGLPPTAPHVRILNFSIGDRIRVFYRHLSPLAKLLDWAAWKYKILILVSAGNCPQEIKIATNGKSISDIPAEALREQALKFLIGKSTINRVLSPGESLNSVTVGASHSDKSAIQGDQRFDPIFEDSLFSPISSFGMGYRRSVKPEILMPGGRLLYRASPVEQDGITALQISHFSGRPPGIRTASPGKQGALNNSAFFCGTSHATALASRLSFDIMDKLIQIPEYEDAKEKSVCLSKALLVHGASWGKARDILEPVLNIDIARKRKDALKRYLGYGLVEPDRSLFSLPNRVTVLGFGRLGDNEGNIFELPLPGVLSEQSIMRRLIITLAWLSPINPLHRNYRKSALWFDFVPTLEEFNPLGLSRKDYQFDTVKRGTLQHEIFEGTGRANFDQSTNLKIRINCKADAGDLNEEIEYGLAVTLEVAEEFHIYEELKQKLSLPIPIRA